MNKIWYAVMMDENDNDWGVGSYDRDEAIAKVKRAYPESGWVAIVEEVIDEATGETVDSVMTGRISHEEIFAD